MNILITGGAGYLGSVLIERLFNNGGVTKLIVYDNLMYNQTSLIHYSWRKNFEFVYGDVRDQEKLSKYVAEADVIIPLAAIVGFPACDRDKDLATAVNYTHVKFICDRIKNTNKKIIYPNTNSGYGIGENGECTEESPLNPISHYGVTKVNAEREVLNYGGISIRLATVFGSSPRMRMDLLVNEFVYKALTDKYITIFEKNFIRNYIHIRDVANTFVYMIENYEKLKGDVFNVGLSNANLSKQQLVDNYGNPEVIMKSVNGSGFNSIQLPWKINYGDEFRFEGREDFAYMVKNIFGPAESGSGRIFQTGSIEVHFNANLPVSASSNVFNLDHFLIRRYVDDAGQNVITGFRPPGSQGPYLIKPEFIVPELDKNIDEIILDLTQKGLIT
jgi:nucleoside-diphosphate-sugar epimerase